MRSEIRLGTRKEGFGWSIAAVVAVAVRGAAACSTENNAVAEDFLSPDVPSIDAAVVTDARIVEDASIDAAEAAPIMKSTFEAASTGCNEWRSGGADAIRSVPAHSGSFACRFCANGTQSVISLGRSIGPLLPGSYTLSAWVSARDDRPAPDAVVALVRADAPDAPFEVAKEIPLRTSYSLLTVPFEVPSRVDTIQISFRADADVEASGHACVLVDDVFIVKRREGA